MEVPGTVPGAMSTQMLTVMKALMKVFDESIVSKGRLGEWMDCQGKLAGIISIL